MTARRTQARRGLSLAESLLACVLLAACVSGVTIPFTASIRNDQIQQRMETASNLATELMEEILAKPFDDPQGSSQMGPESGETTRSLFDNADDYDKYTESAGALTGLSGAVETDATGLSRSVTVESVYLSGQDASESPSFVRVTVEVYYAGETLVSLTRLVSRAEG